MKCASVSMGAIVAVQLVCCGFEIGEILDLNGVRSVMKYVCIITIFRVFVYFDSNFYERLLWWFVQIGFPECHFEKKCVWSDVLDTSVSVHSQFFVNSKNTVLFNLFLWIFVCKKKIFRLFQIFMYSIVSNLIRFEKKNMFIWVGLLCIVIILLMFWLEIEKYHQSIHWKDG